MESNTLINPHKYGLGKRIKLIEISDNHIGILKKRKSRIIMKDGLQILEIANSIRNVDSHIKISLIISGPLCSKTSKYLDNNFIDVITV